MSSDDESGGRRIVTSSADRGDELEGLFVPGGGAPAALLLRAGEPEPHKTPAVRVKYGGGPSSGRPKESTATDSPVTGTESGTSAGSGSARSRGEIADLSGGAPRLKSRLSSPPSVPLKRGREAGSSGGKEGPLSKKSRAASPSDSKDGDGATLTVLRRRRSVRSGPAGGLGQNRGSKPQTGGSAPQVADGAAEVAVDAEPIPAATDGALPCASAGPVPTTTDDASPGALVSISAAPFPPTPGASGGAAGVLRAESRVLASGEVETHPSGVDGSQGNNMAGGLELEPLTLGNAGALASRSLAQVWVCQTIIFISAVCLTMTNF